MDNRETAACFLLIVCISGISSDSLRKANPTAQPTGYADGGDTTAVTPRMEGVEDGAHVDKDLSDDVHLPTNTSEDPEVSGFLFLLVAASFCMLICILVLQVKRCTLRKGGFDLQHPEDFMAGKYNSTTADFTESTYQKIEIDDTNHGEAEEPAAEILPPAYEEIAIPADKDVDVAEYVVMFKNKIFRLIKELSKDN